MLEAVLFNLTDLSYVKLLLIQQIGDTGTCMQQRLCHWRRKKSPCLKGKESQQGTQPAGEKQLESRATPSEKAPSESKTASSAGAFHPEGNGDGMLQPCQRQVKTTGPMMMITFIWLYCTSQVWLSSG